MSGPALLPAAGAFAAVGSSAPSLPTATSLSGFSTTRTSVRVGGELLDAVTVLPRAARTVTVQMRRAGTTRFTNASTGHASAAGRFVAALTPRAAGVWQFRLVVAATSSANRFVSPMRTVQASGTAAATRFQGFDSTAARVHPGGTVKDLVTVSPGGHRVVRVQARRLGTQTFATLATGRTSRAGTFTAVYRPGTSGAWAFRLVVSASAIARRAVSPERTVAVTGVTPGPTPTQTVTTSPVPATPAPLHGNPPVSPTTAFLSVNGSTGATAKLTVNLSQAFQVGGTHAGPGLSLLSGSLDYGDDSAPDTFSGEPALWMPTDHQYGHKYMPTVKATLTVMDSAFVSVSRAVVITVYSEPTATISPVGSKNGLVGQQMTFEVKTKKPDDTSFTEWDSFSADVDSVTGNFASGLGEPPATVTQTFTKAGTYTVYLDVVTDAGDSFVSTTVVIS